MRLDHPLKLYQKKSHGERRRKERAMEGVRRCSVGFEDQTIPVQRSGSAP